MTMKKALIGLYMLAFLAALAIILYAHWISTQSVFSVPSTPELVSNPGPDTGFALWEKPRPLPDLGFVDGEGQALTLADFRGKAVVLNIWATWCVPCQEEMPSLDRLQAMLGGPDFEVVALSVDRAGIPVVKDFYQEHGIGMLRVYVDESGAAPFALNLPGIPTTLLVDREGREVGRKLGIAEWDSAEIVTVIRRYLDIPAEAMTKPEN
jgi:thiol-disulfide isomerase/thioredoxin